MSIFLLPCKKRILAVLIGLCALLMLLCLPRPALAASNTMTWFEKKIVETGFRLLPEKHPFVQAYEEVYDVDIESFVTNVYGLPLSGVPFEFGGKGDFIGFNEDWWKPTGNAKYPVKGIDCAEFVVWIYRQLGYTLPDSSAGLFLSGVEGVERKLPGVRKHLVIPSFEDALIGDVCYNSQDGRYRSGHGSHTQMFLGTADKIGITEALQRFYPDFPGDAYLVLDCGFSDGGYYFLTTEKLAPDSARTTMAGVGVQFFSSIKNGGEVIYQSPTDRYVYWEYYHFIVNSWMESCGRHLQYDPEATVDYPMNIARPMHRPDAAYQPPQPAEEPAEESAEGSGQTPAPEETTAPEDAAAPEPEPAE